MVMSRAERIANLIGVVLPFLGLIAAVVLLWNRAVDWIDLAIMLATYFAFGFGITIGYHRLLTHRGFKTHKPLEYTFAVLGSTPIGAPLVGWVAEELGPRMGMVLGAAAALIAAACAQVLWQRRPAL